MSNGACKLTSPQKYVIRKQTMIATGINPRICPSFFVKTSQTWGVCVGTLSPKHTHTHTFAFPIPACWHSTIQPHRVKPSMIRFRFRLFLQRKQKNNPRARHFKFWASEFAVQAIPFNPIAVCRSLCACDDKKIFFRWNWRLCFARSTGFVLGFVVLERIKFFSLLM